MNARVIGGAGRVFAVDIAIFVLPVAVHSTGYRVSNGTNHLTPGPVASFRSWVTEHFELRRAYGEGIERGYSSRGRFFQRLRLYQRDFDAPSFGAAIGFRSPHF